MSIVKNQRFCPLYFLIHADSKTFILIPSLIISRVSLKCILFKDKILENLDDTKLLTFVSLRASLRAKNRENTSTQISRLLLVKERATISFGGKECSHGMHQNLAQGNRKDRLFVFFFKATLKCHAIRNGLHDMEVARLTLPGLKFSKTLGANLLSCWPPLGSAASFGDFPGEQFCFFPFVPWSDVVLLFFKGWSSTRKYGFY